MMMRFCDWTYETIIPAIGDIRNLLDDLTLEDDKDDRESIKWKIFDKLDDIENYLE